MYRPSRSAQEMNAFISSCERLKDCDSLRGTKVARRIISSNFVTKNATAAMAQTETFPDSDSLALYTTSGGRKVRAAQLIKWNSVMRRV
eukprot:CAMPEP_0175981670 /NCGR_PEP_ID=MMETSP0108-20121206/47470_1 /TAXON_ID=195067 ORGANISM="Goniomonas pacifica, Strain CCMP1869" /NCGR_SAMPLE_ID=MMETSP0108 /ASSEMBLY_ACC=CAM_ASM_000204 /LENGTH=88 /DNA_ID=CAMNT_0017312237 /DNA_START=446 /DNA_END=708 /DNA_ORIENTATION=+